MTIAQTFKFLDKQTNNPITDFSKIVGDDIYNSVENAILEIPAALKDLEGDIKARFSELASSDFLQEAMDVTASAVKDAKTLFEEVTGEINGVVSSVKGGIDSLVREANGYVQYAKDLASIGPRAIESFISNILPAGVSNNAVKSLAQKCKNSIAGAGAGSNKKPWDISGGCGSGGKAGCTSSSVSGVINKATGGLYGGVFKDVNHVISGIVGLANLSYSVNLCGAFGALLDSSGLLTLGQKSRAAGDVFGSIASAGNMFGLGDFAKTVQGLNPMNMIPNALSSTLNNFTGAANRSIASVASTGLAGFDLLDDDWSYSDDFTGLYSCKNTGEMSEDVGDLFNAAASSVKSNDLDFFDDSPVNAIATISNAAREASKDSGFNFTGIRFD